MRKPSSEAKVWPPLAAPLTARAGYVVVFKS
ncbi:hypothetical protein SAMN05444521_7869 [Streptomyces sp. 3214.6]|nr:hypothetical protein SAMN05444521_7869 [Streptomyces sp. 3214.6]